MGGCLSTTPEEKGRFNEVYTLGRTLDKGAFGTVRTAHKKDSAKNSPGVAVKVIDLRRVWYDYRGHPCSVCDPVLLKSARSEAAVWRRVGVHKNVVGLHETYVENQFYYMVMEKCEDSLLDRLPQLQYADAGEYARIFRDMTLAIQHLHTANIVHRDVKPPNFLYTRGGRSHLKLCDFGMAVLLPRGNRLTKVCGTAAYMSPEMIGGQGYDRSTDMWSLGATLYVCLYGVLPYEPPCDDDDVSSEAMTAAILSGTPPPQFRRLRGGFEGHYDEHVCPSPPGEAVQFLRSIFRRSRDERSSAEQVLHHPFLARVGGSQDEASRASESCSSDVALTFASTMLASERHEGSQFGSSVASESDTQAFTRLVSKDSSKDSL